MDRKMLKQLEDMQKKMLKAQEDLANETVSASAGGGAVTVEMNGHHQVVAVTIDKDAVDPDDVETLQDMVLTAFNAALDKAQEMAQQKMGAITGGLNVPGLF
ncbi:MAG TPA: YbaB/EbfC family nucleoid-associated protein [Chloroflexia bacterium]|nr:YbaB/EbfC family nucleoid-associated protein [Chloroflexia bacterium]